MTLGIVSNHNEINIQVKDLNQLRSDSNYQETSPSTPTALTLKDLKDGDYGLNLGNKNEALMIYKISALDLTPRAELKEENYRFKFFNSRSSSIESEQSLIDLTAKSDEEPEVQIARISRGNSPCGESFLKNSFRIIECPNQGSIWINSLSPVPLENSAEEAELSRKVLRNERREEIDLINEISVRKDRVRDGEVAAEEGIIEELMNLTKSIREGPFSSQNLMSSSRIKQVGLGIRGRRFDPQQQQQQNAPLENHQYQKSFNHSSSTEQNKKLVKWMNLSSTSNFNNSKVYYNKGADKLDQDDFYENQESQRVSTSYRSIPLIRPRPIQAWKF
ncbi:expressed protein [Phakopsora pachyrhizi]|uniref:Expressed protein n=1 Tax=Phakopsora pachyrhizi TaxID=170000 RepID=A0AAV0AW77_PHAPC|nr:expressed protein [Phakopsora pachyrhizi]